MSTLRLPAKKVSPVPPAPAPQPAPTPAKAKAPERTPEEKAERARAQAEFERKEHLEAVQRRQRRVREARAEFRLRWPAAFTTPVPLVIGVDKLIRAEMPQMTTSRLKEVLGPWMHSIVYMRAIAAGVERINLDGTPAGVPDEEQRGRATEELRERGRAVQCLV